MQVGADSNIYLTTTQVVSALMVVVLWMARAKIRAWDIHLEECMIRRKDDDAKHARINTDIAVLTEKSETVEEKLSEVRTEQVWIGDVIIRIGSKIGADIPDRPMTREFEKRGERHGH